MLNKIIRDSILFPIFRNPFDVDAAEGTADYGVLGANPKFAADFIDNKYFTDAEAADDFASAITHVRNGNAVMTDGYGPELVVNGGFDSDSDWTKGAGWSIADGVASSDGSQSSSSALQAVNILTIGKTYVVTFTVVSRSAGSITARAGTNGVGTGRTATGTYTEIITCAGTDDLRMTASNDFVGSIDSVSVREMPVLKWAPHNQFPESEDVSGWSLTGLTPTTNATTAPDGTTTADLLTVTNGASSTLATNVTDTGDVFALWVKNNGADFLSVYFSGYSGRAWVDLSDFTAGSATGNISIKGITSAGNDWYLIEFQKQDNSSRAPVITLTDANNGGTVTGDGVKGIYVWGAHLYRSDLGGMVDNPDQPPSRASYVPTTSSAVYLPRVGHHVYNGSAWVNEGLLAESEQRVNVMPRAYIGDDVYDTAYTQEVTVDANNTTSVSPAGNYDAAAILETVNNTFHRINPFATYELSQPYTHSVYVKSIGGRHLQFTFSSNRFGSIYINFDLANGVVGTVDGYDHYSIEDVGNGWYRCSATATCTIAGSGDASIVSVTSPTSGRLEAFAGDTTKGLLIYGHQVEKGSTPSSLIPTSGSSVTRAAESFTIPSVNLPWPEPNYIGSELVTNGTFDTDTSGWTISNADLASVSGELQISNQSTSPVNAYQTISLTVGKVYAVSVTSRLGGSGGSTARASLFGNIFASATSSTPVTETIYLVATSSSPALSLFSYGTSDTEAYFDNISVREIDPLSVSIAMDGRVSYADTGTTSEAFFFQWYAGGQRYIRYKLDTSSARQGEIDFLQRESTSGLTIIDTADDYLQPDILVPYNIAGRHGSTFINGATDGVALTANTTPTALADLETIDLSLAHDYMGTIGTFRVWDRDLGDDGIVEATNPSLEPSLSLTFEGTGTNSFVINDWSE